MSSMSKPWGLGAVMGLLIIACGGHIDTSDPTYPLTSTGASTGSSPDCAGQVAGRYELVRKRNFASPFAEPAGITYDGQDLWILAGDGQTSALSIVRIDPQTLATDRTFAVDLTQGVAGARAGGLAWDGQSLWSATSDDYNAIFRIDPTTGTVTKTFSSPTELGPVDLDFDGTDLWLSTGTGEVYTVDPTTGELLRSFAAGGVSSRDYGVAVRKCEVWVGELLDNGLQIFDPENGHLLSSAVDEQGQSFASTGWMQFVGDQLVIVNEQGVTYYDVVPIH
jgi:streptogramin lyase